MKLILALWKAMKSGEQLANSETWKNRQTTISLLVSVIGALSVGLPYLGVKYDFTAEDITAIAGGIAAIGGLLNSVLTTTTSKSVGLSPKPESNSKSLESGPYNPFDAQ
jgi:hypothetical protein